MRTTMIDWIYVEPQKRLMGVGKGLIEEVRKFVSAEIAGRLKKIWEDFFT